MRSIGTRDSEIWTSFLGGEEWAISFIYSEYAENLYRYGLKFTSNTHLVEDTLQDLFTDLIRSRSKLGQTDHILFYLLKMFKRRLLRKLQSENRFVDDKGLKNNAFDVKWSVEQDLIMKEVSDERIIVLLNALNELTPRQKEVIYLRFNKELDYKEISELMDISVESCRNLISKSYQVLKNFITHKGGNPAIFFILLLKGQ
jgi:RNA polymerase sigma factor (sigma-70 family)